MTSNLHQACGVSGCVHACFARARLSKTVRDLNSIFVLFRLQIDTYEKLFVEVDGFKGTTMFDTWFCVDAKPFKQALLNIIKRWSYMFKQHLIDHVTNR